MKSICTERCMLCGGRPRKRRGVAEVELLLIIIVILLPILFLMGGAKRIGSAMLDAVFDAENNAYTQVVSGGPLSLSTDPTPPAGIIAVRPDLPNRIDVEVQTGTVLVNYGSLGTPEVSYREQAAFLDPSWHLGAYPPSSASVDDHAMIRDWFVQYVEEDHPQALIYSLGLQPPGPP